MTGARNGVFGRGVDRRNALIAEKGFDGFRCGLLLLAGRWRISRPSCGRGEFNAQPTQPTLGTVVSAVRLLRLRFRSSRLSSA
jgi:hypothetical protein